MTKELKLAALRVAAARHSSRHTVQKVQHSATESYTPKQHFPIVTNVASDAALRRIEQRLDTLQNQMEQILRTFTTSMAEIRDSVREGEENEDRI